LRERFGAAFVRYQQAVAAYIPYILRVAGQPDRN
jgi:hypothetical protein